MSDLNYLQLVNTVLAEAKITLDPLTAANFADPPRTAMYNNVKRWVNEAMRELLTTRNEWFTRKEQTLVTIYPRVRIAQGIVPPIVGYRYRGTVSGVEFTVVAIHNPHFTAGTSVYEATLSVAFDDDEEIMNDLAAGEPLDVISPSPTLAAARYQGPGYYNLAELVSNAELIDANSITFQPTLEDYDEGAQWYESAARQITWRDMLEVQRGWKTSSDRGPYHIARIPTGEYAFWPPISKKSLVGFDYTRAITDMVQWSDSPIGIPEKYQMWIVWRAVQEYGDFQQNGQIWSRGNKNAEKFMLLMDRDNSPMVTLTGWEG